MAVWVAVQFQIAHDPEEMEIDFGEEEPNNHEIAANLNNQIQEILELVNEAEEEETASEDECCPHCLSPRFLPACREFQSPNKTPHKILVNQPNLFFLD